MGQFHLNRLLLHSIQSRSDIVRARDAISLPSMFVLAFCFVVITTQLVPDTIRNAHYSLPRNIERSQLPIGPTLSKGTLEDIYLVVIYYIPSALTCVAFLVLLMVQLRASIFASMSMFPSSIRYYAGRFFGAVERGVLHRLITFR